MGCLRVVISMCALMAAPVYSGSCYKCLDGPSLSSGDTDPTISSFVSALGAAAPSCSAIQFGEGQSAENTCQTVELPGLSGGCAKVMIGDTTMRFCLPVPLEEGCQEQASGTICFCRGELCNGAGQLLPGMALLLAVVTAILAAFKQ